MLWIDPFNVLCVALIGGIIGGCLMHLTMRYNNKLNLKVLEQYWQIDIAYLTTRCDYFDKKISTISVGNSVSKLSKPLNNNGYKQRRPFKHGDLHAHK